jgi:hypothetical protein
MSHRFRARFDRKVLVPEEPAGRMIQVDIVIGNSEVWPARVGESLRRTGVKIPLDANVAVRTGGSR